MKYDFTLTLQLQCFLIGLSDFSLKQKDDKVVLQPSAFYLVLIQNSSSKIISIQLIIFQET